MRKMFFNLILILSLIFSNLFLVSLYSLSPSSDMSFLSQFFSKYCFNLEKLSDGTIKEKFHESFFGAKTANLIKMGTMNGIRIPEGFVLNVDAFKDYLNSNCKVKVKIAELENKIETKLENLNKTQEQDFLLDIENFVENEIKQDINEIQNILIKGILPEKLKKEIEFCYEKLCCKFESSCLPVAVRSSAIAEDKKGASYAGRYDSYLNQIGLDQVLYSVKKCWASLYNPRAIKYQMEQRLKYSSDSTYSNSLKLSKLYMPVLILRLINAEAAGTGFSVNKINGKPGYTVYASYGLGESVVGGSIIADCWIFDDNLNLVMKRCGEKAEKYINIPQGKIKKVLVPLWERERFSLSDKQVKEVLEAIKTVKEQSGFDVDIEFVFDKDNCELYSLQTRPETVWSDSSFKMETIDREKIRKKKIKVKNIFKGGICVVPKAYTGILKVVSSIEEAKKRVKKGDIVVTTATTNIWEPILFKCGAAIVDLGDEGCHTALVMGERQKSALVGTGNAVEILSKYDGKEVTVDPVSLEVFLGKLPIIETTEEEVNSLFGEKKNQKEIFTDKKKLWESKKILSNFIEEDDKRWIKKPAFKVTPLYSEIIIKAYAFLSKGLGLEKKIEVIDKDGIIHVSYDELFEINNLFLEKSFLELEKIYKDWIDTGKEYLKVCKDFDGSIESFKEYIDLSTRYTAFMALAYNLYMIVEQKLNNEFKRKNIGFLERMRIRQAQIRKSFSETEEMRKDEIRLKNMLKFSEKIENKINYIKEYGVFYKHNKEDEDFDRREQDVIKNIEIEQIESFDPADLLGGGDDFFDPKSLETYYPNDEEFQKTLALTTNIELERQNSHHLRMRGQWLVKNKIEEIFGKGDCFWNKSIVELEDILISKKIEPKKNILKYENITETMNSLLIDEIIVEPISKYISKEKYNEFIDLGFTPIFLPLKNRWFFIDSGSLSNNFADPLMRKVGLKTRNIFDKEKIKTQVLPNIAYKLGINNRNIFQFSEFEKEQVLLFLEQVFLKKGLCFFGENKDRLFFAIVLNDNLFDNGEYSEDEKKIDKVKTVTNGRETISRGVESSLKVEISS